MHDLVELRAVNEVIVQLILHIGPQVRTESIVVKGHQRVAIQQDPIARGWRPAPERPPSCFAGTGIDAGRAGSAYLLRASPGRKAPRRPPTRTPIWCDKLADRRPCAHSPRDAHAIDVLIVLGDSYIVENGNSHLDRFQCLATAGGFLGQKVPLTVPIGERRGLPIDFNRQLGGGKQQAARMFPRQRSGCSPPAAQRPSGSTGC